MNTAAALRPARFAAGHLALLRYLPYLRARRFELSYQAWFLLQAMWRSLCGTLPLYDYLIRPTGLLFALVGGIVLRSVRALDGFLDDRAALIRNRRRSVSRPVAALAFFTAVVLLLSFTLFGTGLEVFIGGESIGFVGSEAEFDAALREVETRVSGILGRPFSVAPDVRYRFGTVNRHRIFDHDEVVNQLFGQVSDVRRLFALSINGVVVAALENPADIETVLETVEEALIPIVPGLMQHNIVEQLHIDRRWVDANLLTTAAGLESMLLGQRRTAQVTAQAAGETVAVVAARHGMSEQGLLALNQTGTIEAGQQIVLSEAISLLTVMATAYRITNEVIDFDYEFLDDNTMYKGQTRTVTAGVPGIMRVTEEVTYRNGTETGSVVIDTQEIEAPIQHVYLIGTRQPPSDAPTGVFARPLARGTGSFNSPFGWRTLNGARDNHTGVDWSAPSGTPILAADSGTIVTVKRLAGSYGLHVIIDHGVNARGQRVTTLYAHCSSISVREGERVMKGQVIARVGNTGRSYGSHLHFEVRLNGSPVNPLSNVHSNVPR